jgi:deoxyuridine 5'-triphosphate nucleotidohydrolase
MVHIKIAPTSERTSIIYNSNEINLNPAYNESAGFDLICPRDIKCIHHGQVIVVDMEVKIEIIGNLGLPTHFIIIPRSSIYKHNLVLMNSIGLIDKGYRGNIKAIFLYVGENEYTIPAGTKLVQVVSININDFNKIGIVTPDELSDSLRGERGFGSSTEGEK